MASTYDDFVGAARKAGLYDSFSQDDLTIAKSKPEYGMSLLKLQQDMEKASTAEQKLLAQEAVNQLRKSYSPVSSGYSYGGQSAYDKALQGVTGYAGYQFDQKTNPVYVQVKDTYLDDLTGAREQLLNRQQVTGGSAVPGYADTAAGQASGYYGTRLNDALPAIEQNSYNQYLEGLGLRTDQLAAVTADRNFDYNRWLQEQQLDMAAKQQQYANDMTLHQNFGTAAPKLPDFGKTGSGTQFTYDGNDAYKKALEAVTGQKEFSYDAASDPLYASLRKSYLREGQRAGEDALAMASAGSGGVPSSYAIRAAAEAENGYLEQLMNGMPTLQDNAYSRYLQDFDTKLNALGQLQADREMDYNQWLQNYQLEQQKKQQTFDNAMARYRQTGLTPELAAILGVKYVAPAVYDDDDDSGSRGRSYTADENAAFDFVDRMLQTATSSRFDPSRVVNGTNQLTSAQKEIAQEYLAGAIASGRMK